MRHPLKLFIIVALAITVNTCSTHKTRVDKIKNGIELHTQDINVRVQYYTENIVRILKWNTEGTQKKLSLSVIMTDLPDIELTSRENRSVILLKSSALAVKISKIDGNIEYLTTDSKSILKEKGKPEFTPVVYDSDSGFSVKQQFKLTAGEGIYGLGQHQYGYFNYREREVKLVQTNTDAVNPFLISTENYGILWDNYSKTIFKDTRETTSLWSDMGDNIDYYFIRGNTMDEVISGYRQLTGTVPMYGKHAYGYWQSKEHYDTQAELMSVAEKYRRLKYPVDNMIQDWDYWNGAENWSGMFFDKKLFPRPKVMCDRLHAMNYHIIISIWPALGPNTPIYADMEKHGYLYKPVGWAGFKYYDAFNPAANKLYWKYLKQGLYSKGLDGWWIDSTEPDVINALTKESTEYELKKMGSNYLGSWARYLNAFSLVMTNDIYKFWREETSDRRAYILTRSTYAGQQRNAATTWSGDIGANWDIYRRQISAGLNHSMSGIPYWTFDIGAFVIGAYGGVFYNGGKDPAYQELYTRMFQLGTFSPIFRSHGSETPREIWEMGEFTEPILKFDKLRYRLMPYIYSLAWKVTNEDYTIMRGLPMDFAGDKKTYFINDQFMFGPSIMACPVTKYMYYHPPEPTVIIEPEYFSTNDGQQGLDAYYYKDNKYENLGKHQVDPNINIFWYTGRPDYVTDSMFAIRWEGKLLPKQTGKYQFHLKSFDAKRIYLDGKELKMVYTSVEQYTEVVMLEAGKEYNFVLETENSSTGAARMQLFWKTPEIFAQEETKEEIDKTRKVYLPQEDTWFDFWTGKTLKGGKLITASAPIDIMPLYIRAGSILPMGPFLQYATEKPADPLELRIYPEADGSFTLYEDENNNYNYEKGIYSTIDFHWDNTKHELTISERKGQFPGMLKERTFNIVIVKEKHGNGLEITEKANRTVNYTGKEMKLRL
jgi:alpha-D-xyloside xylohydrolase